MEFLHRLDLGLKRFLHLQLLLFSIILRCWGKMEKNRKVTTNSWIFHDRWSPSDFVDRSTKTSCGSAGSTVKRERENFDRDTLSGCPETVRTMNACSRARERERSFLFGFHRTSLIVLQKHAKDLSVH